MVMLIYQTRRSFDVSFLDTDVFGVSACYTVAYI